MNTKLRNCLFEAIWERKERWGIVLWEYYNDGSSKLPKELVIMAQTKFIQEVFNLYGLKWNDIIHNACE